MNQANRLDNNAKWMREQFHDLRNNEIVFIWNTKERRIKQMDEEIKICDIQVSKQTGNGYTMYRKMEESK